MPTTTYKVVTSFGVNFMRVNLREASSPIEFGATVLELSPTPYQTSDAQHRLWVAGALAIFAQGAEYWKGTDYEEEDDPLGYIGGLLKEIEEEEEEEDGDDWDDEWSHY